MIENEDQNMLLGKKPSLFHLLKMRKRREDRMIHNVQDGCGGTQTSAQGIVRTFVNFLRRKYESIAVDVECVTYMAKGGKKEIWIICKDALGEPITLVALRYTVGKGEEAKCKAIMVYASNSTKPTGRQSRTKHWLYRTRYIYIYIYIEGKATEQQKHGVIMCVPKSKSPTKPEDFRPITFLNNDCKLMAQIIANRLRPMLEEILQPCQHCGVPGNTIF